MKLLNFNFLIILPLTSTSIQCFFFFYFGWLSVYALIDDKKSSALILASVFPFCRYIFRLITKMEHTNRFCLPKIRYQTTNYSKSRHFHGLLAHHRCACSWVSVENLFTFHLIFSYLFVFSFWKSLKTTKHRRKMWYFKILTLISRVNRYIFVWNGCLCYESSPMSANGMKNEKCQPIN